MTDPSITVYPEGANVVLSIVDGPRTTVAQIPRKAAIELFDEIGEALRVLRAWGPDDDPITVTLYTRCDELTEER